MRGKIRLAGLLRGFTNWRLALLFRLHRVQHEMIKAVPPIVAMFAEVEINIGALWQPKRGVLLWKRNWSVLNCLMLTDELNLWHRTHHIGLDSHNLKLVGSNPCSTLQIYRVHLIADFIAVHSTGPVFSLAEVHQPGCLSAPVTQSFTRHSKVAPHIWVKYQSERGESAARDLVGVSI